MSKKLIETKKSLDRLIAITKDLSEIERGFIKASVKYKNLGPKTKQRYLEIYQYYVKEERTEIETAQHFDVDIGTVRNVINLFGQQLVIFARDKNIIVPKLDEIRRRKQKVQQDIDKLGFEGGEDFSQRDSVLANTRIKYMAEWRKLEELELKLRSLLTPDTQMVVDNSKKQINFVSNFDKPAPNVQAPRPGVPAGHAEKIIEDAIYEELP